MKRWCMIIFFFSLFLLEPLSAAQHGAVLVRPFQNLGGKEYAWLSSGITDSVLFDLKNVPGLYVISAQDRKEALQEIRLGQTGLLNDRTITEAGRITGANMILTGSYQIASGIVRVNARLVSVATAKTIRAVKLDGTMADLFSLQDRIVVTLFENAQVGQKSAPPLSAYQWYAMGLEIRHSDPARGEEYFTKAIEIDPDYIDAWIKLGYQQGRVFSKFDDAIVSLKTAEKILLRKKMDKSAKFAYLKMNQGILYGVMTRWQDAGFQYRSAQDLYTRLGLQSSNDYSILLTNLAAYNQETGRLDQAKAVYDEILRIQGASGMNASILAASNYLNMGNLYQMKGDLRSALRYYEKAEKICLALGMTDSGLYSMILNNLGLIHFHMKKIDKAMAHYTRSRKIRENLQLQETKEYASLLMNQGIIHSIKKDYSRAEANFFMAMKIYQKLGQGESKTFSSLLLNLASAAMAQKKFTEAYRYLQESRELKERLGLARTESYGNVILNMGVYYILKGESEKAKPFLRQALEIYQAAGYRGPMRLRAEQLLKKYR